MGLPKGFKHSPETKAKMRAAALKRFENQAERDRMSEIMRANWQRPEYREPTLAAFAQRPKTWTPEREAEYRRDYYRENADAIRAKVKEWYRLNTDRARESYRQWLELPGNRERVKAAIKRHYKRNPDKLQMKKQRRRARELNAFVEDVDRREVLRRHNGVCGWCAEPVDPANFHVDHIVALCLGGEHSYANTQPTHPECNIAKRVVLKERAA